jgi:hypothetical protein
MRMTHKLVNSVETSDNGPEASGYSRPALQALGNIASATLGMSVEGIKDLFGDHWKHTYSPPVVENLGETAAHTLGGHCYGNRDSYDGWIRD